MIFSGSPIRILYLFVKFHSDSCVLGPDSVRAFSAPYDVSLDSLLGRSGRSFLIR